MVLGLGEASERVKVSAESLKNQSWAFYPIALQRRQF
jgi:hypothetical protein